MRSRLLEIQDHNVETNSPRARSQDSCPPPLSGQLKTNSFLHFCQESQTIFSAHTWGWSDTGELKGTRSSPSLPWTLDILPMLLFYHSSSGVFRYRCGPLHHLYCAGWSVQLLSVPSMGKVAWDILTLCPLSDLWPSHSIKEYQYGITASCRKSLTQPIWRVKHQVVIWKRALVEVDILMPEWHACVTGDRQLKQCWSDGALLLNNMLMLHKRIKMTVMMTLMRMNCSMTSQNTHRTSYGGCLIVYHINTVY